MDSCIYAFSILAEPSVLIPPPPPPGIIILPFFTFPLEQPSVFASSSPLPRSSSLQRADKLRRWERVSACGFMPPRAALSGGGGGGGGDTHVSHMRGQIHSERSRCEGPIDGAPGDGLGSRFINHNRGSCVPTLPPALMSLAL